MEIRVPTGNGTQVRLPGQRWQVVVLDARNGDQRAEKWFWTRNSAVKYRHGVDTAAGVLVGWLRRHW